ncbi:MAG: thioredoxin domain-containing protein [Patescibacteria group bacterium]
MNTNETNKYFLPIAIVVAGLLIAGAVIWNGLRPAGPTGTAGTGTAPKVNIKDVKTDGNPFIGATNAPVTIAFWSDFQCPFCKSAEVGGVPQIPTPPSVPEIIKNYVDTGKVKIVFMDFAFLGNDSITAALYNRSVWKLYPNQYFAWRTAMYVAQDEEGDQGFGDVASIDKLNAKIPDLDAAKIAADVEANKAVYQAMIDSDKAEAQKVGINATPSFIIGTEVIAGAYPFAKLQSVIDPLLK